MPRHTPPPNPRRHLPAWLLVGLLHLGLALLLWKLPLSADRTGPGVQQPPLVVTLWEQVRNTMAPKPPTAAAPKQPTPARLPQPTRAEPQAITAPAEPTAPTPAPPSAPAAQAAGEATGAPAQAAAPPQPLNLTLPRGASAPWRQRNPALDDPRANTAKLTLEQKLANAMGGDGSWHMERLDNDHIRYRRGDECVLATRSRAGQLELGNGAFRNAWMVGNC